jgi:hypothetical protein
MRELDIEGVAERLYRAIMRDGRKVVVVSPEGRFSAVPADSVRADKLWRLEYSRIMGLYDRVVSVDDLVADVGWFCRKLGFHEAS